MSAMHPADDSRAAPAVPFYDATYGRFCDQLYADIRRETYGAGGEGGDLGQASWLTAADLDRLIPLLSLGPRSRLLDVACGSGGIVMRLAERTGAAVTGVDIHAAAIEQARARPAARALGERAIFLTADASRPLPFADASFDAIVCIDAINHLADRAAVLAEWRRLLTPGGRLLFTDPIVVTGPLDAREIAMRASIGTFIFMPPGENERLLAAAGFRLLETRDETAAVAAIAARWRNARAQREADLRAIEGDDTFDGQQTFLATAATLAAEQRLSRLLYAAAV